MNSKTFKNRKINPAAAAREALRVAYLQDHAHAAFMTNRLEMRIAEQPEAGINAETAAVIARTAEITREAQANAHAAREAYYSAKARA